MWTVSRMIVPVAVVLVATCVDAAPAAAADTAIVTNPTLVARGVAVDFDLTLTCDPYVDYTGTPSTAVEVTVAFRQNVRKNELTTATYDSGFQLLNLCDGSPHTLALQVLPSPYAAIKGSALFNITEAFNSFGGAPTPATFSDVVNVR